MNSFWKNEWDMFTNEVDAALNFLMQPVKFSSKSDNNLMLKPSNKEIIEKSETTSFWKNEWKLFEEEFDSTLNFLMQPVKFSSKSDDNLMLKPSNKEIVEKSETTSFWKNEWNLFEKEFDTTLDFLTKPINFR